MGVREAGRQFGVPEATLRRRKKKRDIHSHNLGPSSALGPKNEMKIVSHIKKQKHGFAPSRSFVRSMAFQLAEQLKLPHKFNRESCKAGYPWLESFLRRNKELTIRKSESVSTARSLTKRVLQLNTRPEHVIAAKGSKNVVSISSAEKGETISVIVCCNAEGAFIPPTAIFKGKNKKPEFQDGMPPGSIVYMSEKSAYVNNIIFFNWLKEQFVPRKPTGKVLLLLDGHSSHCSNVEMLEYAVENDVILFCLPSHTTQFLQPLDRGFFKSFKAFYYEANPGRRITRLQFGKLLGSAWEKSATIKNAVP
ncbi:uncharacterized protein LOC116164704 [Photinus pyralis]|uniref:uncharacterized protein LOC116164704 n=1 Tax=Photinus pyralis TaxID=7054 RepID=UPI00126724E4|nr:uncharacterized protein LOC116164704 [Photinus pyralis]